MSDYTHLADPRHQGEIDAFAKLQRLCHLPYVLAIKKLGQGFHVLHVSAHKGSRVPEP